MQAKTTSHNVPMSRHSCGIRPLRNCVPGLRRRWIRCAYRGYCSRVVHLGVYRSAAQRCQWSVGGGLGCTIRGVLRYHPGRCRPRDVESHPGRLAQARGEFEQMPVQPLRFPAPRAAKPRRVNRGWTDPEDARAELEHTSSWSTGLSPTRSSRAAVSIRRWMRHGSDLPIKRKPAWSITGQIDLVEADAPHR